MTGITAPSRTMSYEEFGALPEGPPFCEREPDGEVVDMPSATSRHNRLVARLFASADACVRSKQLGQLDTNTDVFFPSGRVYMPDLCFMAHEQGRLVADDGKIHGVPTMVAEIISPGGQTRDRVEKFDAYRDEGVQWYWLIDLETLDIEEYHLVEGHYVATARRSGGQVFCPGVFAECEVDLAALMGE